MTKTLICQIVGAHFRPPAKQVLAKLPAGSPIWLQPEPENPYDAKAIKVLVDVNDVPEELRGELAEEVLSAGWELEDLLAEGQLHVGYVPDSDGKVCQKSGEPGNREVAGWLYEWKVVGSREADGKLGFALDGKPTIVLSFDGE